MKIKFKNYYIILYKIENIRKCKEYRSTYTANQNSFNAGIVINNPNFGKIK